MSDDGKKGTAPCGHPGTHVTANYVRCDKGCDAPRAVVRVPDACPKCESTNVAPFHFFGHVGMWHCWDCGAVIK